MFYFLMKNVVIGPLLLTIYRPRVSGMENIPRDGAAIISSNHLSFIDSVFLPLVLDRRIVFLAKSEYFNKKGLKGWLTKLFFHATGQLPLDRSGGKAAEESLEAGLKVLSGGGLLGIYPEGTRSPDAQLYRGRTGVSRMALGAKVPVIPVCMTGTDQIMPISSHRLRWLRPSISIGKPLDFSRYDGYENNRHVLRSVTDEIMYALWELGQQPYQDVYASGVKFQKSQRL